jgi:hypothetical protein
MEGANRRAKQAPGFNAGELRACPGVAPWLGPSICMAHRMWELCENELESISIFHPLSARPFCPKSFQTCGGLSNMTGKPI